jgi:outer membrane protein TolC
MIVSMTSRPAYAEDSPLLKSLVQEALSQNPALSAMRMGVESAFLREPQAAALPDPMLMLGFTNEGFDRYTVGDMPMSRYEVGVSQMFPYPGKLGLKGELSKTETQRRMHALDAARLKTEARVKSLYYDIRRIDKSRKLTALKLQYLSLLEDTVMALYSTGRRDVADVLMVQTDRYMAMERAEMLSGELKVMEADLLMAIGRGQTIGAPESSSENLEARLSAEPELSPTPFNHAAEQLKNLALSASYELLAARKTVDASGVMVRVQKLEAYPDFTVSASYEPRFSAMLPDVGSIRVSFPIPVFYGSKQKQAILESKSEAARMQKEYDDAALKIVQELSANLARIKASDAIMALYRAGLVAKAKLSMETSIAAYKSGSMPVESIIKSINALIDYEDKYAESLTLRQKAIAEIYALTGGKLE